MVVTELTSVRIGRAGRKTRAEDDTATHADFGFPVPPSVDGSRVCQAAGWDSSISFSFLKDFMYLLESACTRRRSRGKKEKEAPS